MGAKKIIAIYPGSFNPFHIGHLNVLEKAKKMFDNVIVSVGVNHEKGHSYYGDKRLEMSDRIHNEVIFHDGLLYELVARIEKETKAIVVIIKGLRDGYDLNYENSQIVYTERIKPKEQSSLNYVFIPCDPEFTLISSTKIRDLEAKWPGSAKNLIV